MSDSQAASVAPPAQAKELAADLQKCSIAEPPTASTKFMLDNYGEFGIDEDFCLAMPNSSTVLTGSLALHAVLKAYGHQLRWRPNNVNLVSWTLGEPLALWLDRECTPLKTFDWCDAKYLPESPSGHLIKSVQFCYHKATRTRFEIVGLNIMYNWTSVHNYLNFQSYFDFDMEHNYYDGYKLFSKLDETRPNWFTIFNLEDWQPKSSLMQTYDLICRVNKYFARGFKCSDEDIQRLLQSVPQNDRTYHARRLVRTLADYASLQESGHWSA